MNKLCLKILILFGLLTNLAYGQNYLKNTYAKTPTQLTGMQNFVTNLDSAYFTSSFGTYIRDLTSAILQRGYSADDFATLGAAIAAAGTDSAFTVVSSSQSITANTTVASHSGLIIAPGRDSRITISTGVTLTINGAFIAPNKQRVFYGAGSVVFGNGAVEKIYPEWWGATNDSTGNSGAAFQSAINSAPLRHATISLNGQGIGYIINTKVTFPKGNVNPREIHIEGNGATIYSSMSDTVFVIRNMSLQSGGALLPRHSIRHVWFRRIDSNSNGVISAAEAGGIAICINNSVEQLVEFCHFENYAIGVLLYNSYQGNTGNTDSTGWTEGCQINGNRFTACDTAIYLKRQYPVGAGHTGHESFATTRIEHNSIAMGGASTRSGSSSKQIVGIGISKHARAYRCSFDQNYFGTIQYCSAFYCDGKLDGTYGHFGFENFGSAVDQPYSFFFDFGSNAANLGAEFFVGYEGLPDLRKFIRSATANALPNIRTWIKGDGSGESRGITTVYKDTASTYLWSLLRSSELDGFKASGATNDSDYTFIAKVSTGRQMTVNFQRTQPLQLFDLDGNLQPVRLIDIGRNRSISKVGDSTGHLSVKNATHLILGSSTSTAGVDTLSKFNGGTIGQLLTVNFNDDSLQINNLTGGQGNGRIFTVNNRSERMISGTKAVYKAEAEGSGNGYFWREIARYTPPNVSTWNPGNLTSGSVDSTTVTVMGAVQGDPVAVGLSSIGTANANIQLWGHVVAINSVRVYARNNSGGTYDIASGNLRIKILK